MPSLDLSLYDPFIMQAICTKTGCTGGPGKRCKSPQTGHDVNPHKQRVANAEATKAAIERGLIEGAMVATFGFVEHSRRCHQCQTAVNNSLLCNPGKEYLEQMDAGFTLMSDHHQIQLHLVATNMPAPHPFRRWMQHHNAKNKVGTLSI